MDIKFTFEDGGEYLAHYGKVGMKWRKGRKTPIRVVSGRKRGAMVGSMADRIRAKTKKSSSSSGNGSGSSGGKKTGKNLEARPIKAIKFDKDGAATGIVAGDKKAIAKRAAKLMQKKFAKEDKQLKKNRKKFGAYKPKKDYDSKAGLSAKYASKVSGTNSNYASAVASRRNEKLMGYRKLHNKG